jgi:hypothetical protein
MHSGGTLMVCHITMASIHLAPLADTGHVWGPEAPGGQGWEAVGTNGTFIVGCGPAILANRGMTRVLQSYQRTRWTDGWVATWQRVRGRIAYGGE